VIKYGGNAMVEEKALHVMSFCSSWLAWIL
jgi:hypothetical protein